MQKKIDWRWLGLLILTLASVRTVWAVSATGGNVTNIGAYTIHTFTNNGTFTVVNGGNVELLVVAGGGSGGSAQWGGGGAGGVIYTNAYAVTNQQIVSVVVGAGGTSADTRGGNSSFGSLTATGGGKGGSRGVSGGSSGGSGGGGGAAWQAQSQSYAGTGTAGQGWAGGIGVWPDGGTDSTGGGGGGAGGVGSAGITKIPGNGGVGLEFPQFAGVGGYPAGWFAGGGGGASLAAGNPVGTGGKGGGGNGGNYGTPAQNGKANTGGGGVIGGSGIVIVRYIPTPLITNSIATNITFTSACLNGYLASTGTSDTAVFVCWGPLDGGTNMSAWANTNHFTGSQGMGPLSTNVMLAAGQEYYYRYGASNMAGNAWANESQYLITTNVMISATPGPIGENNATGVFWIVRPVTTTGGVLTVNYSISGTASNGVDYPLIGSNSVVLAPGSTGVVIQVKANADYFGLYSNKTVILTLTPGGYVVGSPDNATLSIFKTLTSASASGGIMTESHYYWIHTFTNSGTFSVRIGGNVEVLVVAGGGAGGSADNGGGGAGGLIYTNSYAVTNNQVVSVVVGVGGTSSDTRGGSSSFGTLTAIGGGKGGTRSGVLSTSGGSGGGGSAAWHGVTESYPGAGTAGQGNSGGNGVWPDGGIDATGGGGGGAGGVGSAGITKIPGNGGVGLEFPQFADVGGYPAGWFAGGGGGASLAAGNPVGTGGKGGGGNGGNYGTAAQSGKANTGGGGVIGGSGVVIVRYIPPPAGIVYKFR